MSGVWNCHRIRAMALTFLLLLSGQANAQTEIAIGDSIAVGLKLSGQLKGGAVVGASPRMVAHMVGTYPADLFKQAVVILSCGASNDTTQLGYCKEDVHYLTSLGAYVVLLGVGDVIPNSQQVNDILLSYTNDYPNTLFVHGWFEVHPPSYPALLRFIREHECISWRICQV
jgi:hypothetical protein